MSDENIFMVEKIVDSRIHRGKKQYLIKWEGFPASENTWELAKDILSKELINDYEQRRAQTKGKSPRAAKQRKGQPQLVVTNEWHSDIKRIESVYRDEKKKMLMVDIVFESGKTLSVDSETAHIKCPLQLLRYYEENINFVDECWSKYYFIYYYFYYINTFLLIHYIL